MTMMGQGVPVPHEAEAGDQCCPYAVNTSVSSTTLPMPGQYILFSGGALGSRPSVSKTFKQPVNEPAGSLTATPCLMISDRSSAMGAAFSCWNLAPTSATPGI